jgi:GntR family transcriptional regulator, transcriptional repressor for pyruvate dehydrogenase complex
MAKSPEKRSLIYETVLDHIKSELLKGNLQAGDRLPTVVEMAEKLRIAPSSVREAYRVLETLGVLSVTQGRGTFVSSTVSASNGLMSGLQFAEKQSMSHLLETRKLLEPAVAAMAAQRATPSEIEAIMTAVEEMEVLARDGKDFVEPDVRFHELIFMAAHNSVLAKIQLALSDVLLDSRRVTSRIPGATEKAVHYHKLIAMAIKERKPEAARILMYQHVEDVESSVLERVSIEPSGEEI